MSSENYRIVKQDAVYFLTFTVVEWVDVFTRESYRRIIAGSEEFLYSSARNYAGLSSVVEIDVV